jgi:hypothetical protein
MFAGRLRIAIVATIVAAIGLVSACGDDRASLEAVPRGITVWVTNRSAAPKYITVVVSAVDGSKVPAFVRYVAPPGIVEVNMPVPSLPAEEPMFGVISVANPSCADEATWDLEEPARYHLTIQQDGSSDLEEIHMGDEPTGGGTLVVSNICD